MNLLKEIKNCYLSLTKQQKMIADYFVIHHKVIDTMSIKKVAADCNVSPSTITKVCHKIGFEGFKDMLKKTYNPSINDDDRESFNVRVYQNNLCDPIIKTLSELNLRLIKSISQDIIKDKRLVIIYASGKTLILARYMFFILLDMNINVLVSYEKYNPNLYDVQDKVIFVLSDSGNNHQIKEYLKKTQYSNNIELLELPGHKKLTLKSILITIYMVAIKIIST